MKLTEFTTDMIKAMRWSAFRAKDVVAVRQYTAELEGRGADKDYTLVGLTIVTRKGA